MLYSDFLPEVLPEVAGCPDITVERAVRDAVIEFCDKALVYTIDQDPVVVSVGLSEIDLEIPTGTRLVQVLRAQIGRVRLDRVTRDDLYNSGRDWKTERGRPLAITYETDRSIRLVPIPDERLSDSLYVRFAVTPTMASTSVPDAIGERYFREIAFGAKSLLFIMPGQPWSNPQLAGACRAVFDRGMRDAMLDAQQDGVAARKQVRIRRVV